MNTISIGRGRLVVLVMAMMLVASGAFAQWATNGTAIYNTNAGKVGIGTSNPTGQLHIAGAPSGVLRIQNTVYDKSDVAVTALVSFTDNLGSQFAWFGDGSGGVNNMTLYAGPTHGLSIYSGGINVMTIPVTGNVGVGTTNPTVKLDVVGAVKISSNLNVGGTLTGANIAATYQDVAEWVPSTETLAAGTVVVIDGSANNHVRASSTAYDTSVAGVVSGQPGLILGVQSESDVMVATTGRVRVKVDATKAPIAIGDLLVSGEKPGTAIKSDPISISGRSFHQPGTIIGKALEALPDGEGEILVLLSLQ